ncbi:sterol desaturase family protein [Fulvivirga maritima]|uniref:sterol desaturase family protein n=1 Tax=Fulvivirga maritima TaxID=2904247 RepID=UPI001F318159|nr:sterol desaturase family protein [Fulvivirga maritima]UII24446.1 sterol desaturase family protein [Fulvivirga maritima]
MIENSFNKIPEHLRPKNEGTDQLFKSGILEKFTRTHVAVPITMHTIIILVFCWLGLSQMPVLKFLGIFFSGWLIWTFLEYWIHRYVYHVKTENKVLRRIQHMGHGIHHQYPKDPTRLAMPPLPALILLTGFYSIFWLILRENAVAFFPGFLLGYLLYISLHYAQHRYKAPNYGPLKRLWKYHLLHHYKHPEDKAFGVSTLLWDVVFGTLPKEKQK